MKNIKSFAILALLLVVMAIAPALQAQTAVTITSLSGAVTDLGTTTISVTSTSGMTAGTTAIYIDREYMNVRSIGTTTINVLRAQGGTKSAFHNTSAVVWVGPQGQGGPFSNTDGTVSQPAPGRCTATAMLYLPQINIVTGNIWDCPVSSTAAQQSGTTSVPPTGTTSYWQYVNSANVGGYYPYRSIANVAYSIKLYDDVVDYVSMTAARTATMPSISNVFGKTVLVKNSAASQALTVLGANGQYVGTIGTASIAITSGQSIRLLSVGTGWITIDGPL